MITLRPSDDRGRANHGWLQARHTFSFADYYDPANTHFRSLRVINEDRVAPKMGFGMHPHRDMEIITYVVSGALKHSDSMGYTAIMRGGDVQRISAGTGIQHSEVNASASEPVHLLQIWIMPDHKNAQPAYAEKSFADAAPGKLHLIASKTGHDGSIPINQDAKLFLSKLAARGSISHTLEAGRHAWLQLIEGKVNVADKTLQAGDAAQISNATQLQVSALEKATFLLFDLN